MKYEYELSSFINNKFDLSALQHQIEISEIITSIDYASGLGGTSTGGCSINFKDALSPADKSILDAIIAAHDGTPYIAPVLPLELKNEDSLGNLTVAVQPRTGSGLTLITHNFADKKSWYSNSTRVVDKVLFPVNGDYTKYAFADEVIDVENGRITFENKLLSPYSESYIPKLKKNGQSITTGYHIDYINNVINFDLTLVPSDVLTATFYKVNDSTFTIAPAAGKSLVMEHVEVQFSKNVDFLSKQFWFDVWATNPYNINGPKIRAAVPVIYKNVKDFINESNNTLSVEVPAIGELTQPSYIFAWKYPASRVLKSSTGVEIRIFIFDPVTGSKSNLYSSKDNNNIEIATATFYCLSEAE